MSGQEEKRIGKERHQRLCAWMFGELEGEEAAAFEAELARSPELQAERARLAATIGLVRESLPAESLSEGARATLVAAADEPAPVTPKWTFLRGGGAGWKVAAGIAALFTVLVVVRTTQRRALLEGWQTEQVARDTAPFEDGLDGAREAPSAPSSSPESSAKGDRDAGRAPLAREGRAQAPVARATPEPVAEEEAEAAWTDAPGEMATNEVAETADAPLDPSRLSALQALGYGGEAQGAASERRVGGALARSRADQAGTDVPRRSETAQGEPVLRDEPGPVSPPSPGAPGAKATSVSPAPRARAAGGKGGPAAPAASRPPQELVGPGAPRLDGQEPSGALVAARMLDDLGHAEDEEATTGSEGWFLGQGQRRPVDPLREPEHRRWSEEELERYCRRLFEGCRPRPRETPGAMFFRFWGDNPFELTELDDLSTFAVDVDTASYTLARRYLVDGYLPTKAQVRTEEFVNAFDADVPPPTDGETFALALELAPSLFGDDPDAWMLRVAVRGKDVDAAERQPVTLTFVVDVSGSMKGERIGIVKQAMAFCLRELSTTDSVALVTFNNEARMLVPMISAASRGAFEEQLVGLTPGGGTNVEAGLRLGYELAAAAITPGAVNRVVLLSDGVGNIGETDQESLLAEVAEYKAAGIYLNTIGVGMGNHNDVFLEQLANKGDGLCNYVDSLEEARRVFGEELTQTLQPIARDVKIQVELDPEQVERYRLLGYENRAVADEDFRNDAVDAGEVNAGHQVVALYELLLRPSDAQLPLATARLRWKPPFAVDRAEDGAEARARAEQASEIEARIHAEDGHATYDSASYGYRRDVLVAQFAEVLRRSRHARGDSYRDLLQVTKRLRKAAPERELDELFELMTRASKLIERRERRYDHRILEAYDELRELYFLEALRDSLHSHGLEDPDDPELETRLDAVRTELEERIRRLLRERHVGPADPELEEKLRRPGYTDDR